MRNDHATVKLFTGKPVLILGATGFIGSHLCRRLAREGAVVHAASRACRPNVHNLASWNQTDLADISAVRSLLQTVQPQVVFHVAGLATGARSLEFVIPSFRSNLMTTVNVLTVVTEMKSCRLVLAGSLEEPDSTTGDPIPSSPYAATKWACSGYARMFWALYQCRVVSTRIFMVYGPEQNELGKLIPYVTLSFLRGEQPYLSSGSRQIDWIYIDDVVDGLLVAGHAPGLEGKTFDIGSGGLTSIRAVVEKLQQITRSNVHARFGALPERVLERVTAANVTESLRITGWAPGTSLNQGLRRTVAWYKDQWHKGLLPQLESRLRCSAVDLFRTCNTA